MTDNTEDFITKPGNMVYDPYAKARVSNIDLGLVFFAVVITSIGIVLKLDNLFYIIPALAFIVFIIHYVINSRKNNEHYTLFKKYRETVRNFVQQKTNLILKEHEVTELAARKETIIVSENNEGNKKVTLIPDIEGEDDYIFVDVKVEPVPEENVTQSENQ
jgi:uncharacterized membrane-anchored protein YitT (DUF2179 family)